MKRHLFQSVLFADLLLVLAGCNNHSFKAHQEMAWDKAVPKDIFRHFVPPVGVNNERMENFRKVYYNELKERIKGLSLHSAALEINHWCHEKVTYIPSDARTSSPMATIVNAEGVW